MMCERDKELKVLKYAKENNYTILANTFGSIQFVKYDYENQRVAKFLKWPKGSNKITLTCNEVKTTVDLAEMK